MNYKDVNDYELLYMVQENSDDSMEIIFDKYRPLIDQKTRKWSAIYKKLGLGIDTEDIRQEIYYTFFRAIQNYDEQGGAIFYTYICKVLDNHMIMLTRTYNSKANQLFTQALSLVTPRFEGEATLQDFIEDPKSRIEERMDEDYAVGIIREFCYELPLEMAGIFELFLSGFDVSAIAKLVDCTTRNVSHSLFRLRKRLKKELIRNDVSVIL